MAGGFDESKIQRDEHGRFSGGSALGAWAAKTSGKLEGYAPAPKDGLDKWAGKVSGRARDVEIPLARKNEEHIATTGVRPLTEVSGVHADDLKGKKLSLASAMIDRIRREDGNEKRRAEVPYLKAVQEREKIKDEIRKVSRSVSVNGPGKEKLAALEKKIDDHDKKLIPLETRAEETDQRARASNMTEALRDRVQKVMAQELLNRNVKMYGTGGDGSGRKYGEIAQSNYDAMKKEGTLNVSHGHDGSWEMHFEGSSHDANYPGEKSMTVRVEPAKVAYDAKSNEIKITEPARVTITSQYPTDKRGKEHPASAEHDLPLTGSRLDWIKDINEKIDQHATSFFKS